jgi:hypothetical protein
MEPESGRSAVLAPSPERHRGRSGALVAVLVVQVVTGWLMIDSVLTGSNLSWSTWNRTVLIVAGVIGPVAGLLALLSRAGRSAPTPERLVRAVRVALLAGALPWIFIMICGLLASIRGQS